MQSKEKRIFQEMKKLIVELDYSNDGKSKCGFETHLISNIINRLSFLTIQAESLLEGKNDIIRALKDCNSEHNHNKVKKYHQRN